MTITSMVTPTIPAVTIKHTAKMKVGVSHSYNFWANV